MKPIKNSYYCPDCGHNKMRFETKKKADNFIRYNAQEILEESGKAPVRSYYCDICRYWHVTSNPNVEISEVAGEIRSKQINEFIHFSQHKSKIKLNDLELALAYLNGFLIQADIKLKNDDILGLQKVIDCTTEKYDKSYREFDDWKINNLYNEILLMCKNKVKSNYVVTEELAIVEMEEYLKNALTMLYNSNSSVIQIIEKAIWRYKYAYKLYNNPEIKKLYDKISSYNTKLSAIKHIKKIKKEGLQNTTETELVNIAEYKFTLIKDMLSYGIDDASSELENIRNWIDSIEEKLPLNLMTLMKSRFNNLANIYRKSSGVQIEKYNNIDTSKSTEIISKYQKFQDGIFDDVSIKELRSMLERMFMDVAKMVDNNNENTDEYLEKLNNVLDKLLPQIDSKISKCSRARYNNLVKKHNNKIIEQNTIELETEKISNEEILRNTICMSITLIEEGKFYKAYTTMEKVAIVEEELINSDDEKILKLCAQFESVFDFIKKQIKKNNC